MLQINSNFRKYLIIAIFFILLTGALRKIESDNLFVIAFISLLIFLIYMALVLAWGLSINLRVNHFRIRRLLRTIVFLLFFLIFLRTLRFSVFIGQEFLQNLAWYAYYFPLLNIPLIIFWISLLIGRPDSQPLENYYRAMILPSFLFFLLVMTNDWHHLVFSSAKSYEFFYYLIIVWLLLLIILSIKNLYQKSMVASSKKTVWLPLSFVLLFLVYTFFYIRPESRGTVTFVELIAMTSFVTIGLMEGFIQSGLIPANSGYEEFFRDSPLGTIITDYEDQIIYHSDKVADPHAEAGDILQYSAPIRGGRVYWQENVSSIKNLMKELNQTAEEIKDQNEILSEEYRIKAENEAVKERIRLYRILYQQLKDKIDLIKTRLLEAENAGPEEQKRILQEISIYGIHIKRWGNFILMDEEGQKITNKSFKQALAESLDALSFMGVKTELNFKESVELSNKQIFHAYSFFQEIIYREGFKIKEISVSFFEEEKGGGQDENLS